MGEADMTIAERKAREAHDRENPWRPMSERPPVGLICDLQFSDMMGNFPAAESCKFFLDGDGRWYRMGAGSDHVPKPMNWRPAYCFLPVERRVVFRNIKGRAAR